jgi:hypothetical protein
VYDYSKHSSQGNGTGDESPVKTCSSAVAASSSKLENKQVTKQNDMSVTQDDSVKLLPVQVGNVAESGSVCQYFGLCIS